VVGTLVPVTSGEMGLGTQRDSGPWSDAVASCAPRSPGVQPAGEGVLGVSAAVVALSSAKSLSSAASNSSELSGAEISTSKVWSVSSDAGGAGALSVARSDTSCSIVSPVGTASVHTDFHPVVPQPRIAGQTPLSVAAGGREHRRPAAPRGDRRQ